MILATHRAMLEAHLSPRLSPKASIVSRLGIEAPWSLAEHVAELGELPTFGSRAANGTLIDQVERAGLRGRGGGWFPSATKLRAVIDSSAGRRRGSLGRRPVVIGNAMEGEPASHKDATLLAASPHLVLDGISVAAQAIGATDAFLAVHRGSSLVQGLVDALEERRLAGVDRRPIRLVTPPARYVASEESALSHWVGSGVATPTYPQRPFQRGADGRPTLVQNAETLAHLALIARFGGAWYRQEGVSTAPGTTLVTVGGAVASPGVIEAPTGTSVADLVARCGGTTEPVRAYLTGGYGGAWVAADGFGQTSWDPESVRDAGGVVGASVLWLMPASACPLHEVARVSTWMAGESAGQCGPCVFGLASVANDVGLLATRQAGPDDMMLLERRLGRVRNRGGCKHPDGVSRFVSTALATFDDEVRMHLAGRCSAPGESTGFPGLLPVSSTRDAQLATAARDFR